jgi:hypothetical protein
MYHLYNLPIITHLHFITLACLLPGLLGPQYLRHSIRIGILGCEPHTKMTDCILYKLLDCYFVIPGRYTSLTLMNLEWKSLFTLLWRRQLWRL